MSYIHSFWDRYADHFKATIYLSFPVVIAQIGNVLMGFIDTLMIGELGYVPVSASSLANGFFIIIVIIGIGITMAVSPLVAEAQGADRNELIGDYFRNGTFVGIGCGIFLGLLVFLLTELMPYIGQPPEDVALAMPYTRILCISTLPMMIFLSFKHFTDGLSRTRVAMYVTLIGLLANTFINWVLIFGNLGFPRWELNGAGIGTLLSRVIMAVLMGFYILKSPRFQQYGVLNGWRKINREYITKILNLGVPSGFQYFFEAGAFVGAALMVGWIGSAERAAHQIVIQMASITFMVVIGISVGATIRVGNNLGRKNWLEAQRAGLAGIYLSAAFMTCSAITFYLTRYFVPQWFVDEPFVIEIAASLMIFAAFFQIFDGIQAVAVGVLRGIQDVKIPTLITFIAYWLVNLPLGYMLGFVFDFGVQGVWVSFSISLFVASALLTSRFLRITRRKMSAQANKQPVPEITPIA